MPKSKEAKLRFDDAADIINIKQLAEILGICYRESAKLFNSKGFPNVLHMNGKKLAYKYDVAKFLGIGYEVKGATLNEEILNILSEILFELKKRKDLIKK